MNKKDKLEELLAGLYPDLKGIQKDKFLHVVKETGLDPLRNQIYAVGRMNKTPNGSWEKVFTTQTSIDGFRLIAERTGKYAPGKEPKWIYDKDGRLESATAYVKKMTKDGTWHEVGATAYLDEYAQRDKKGNLTRFWQKMSRLMIAKCAEALALRKAFPDALSGVYTDDEMLQADQNDNQNDSQSDKKANKKSEPQANEVQDKRTEEEVNKLLAILKFLPNERTLLEKFLQEKNIFAFQDMPKPMYNKILKGAEKKLDAFNKLKKEIKKQPDGKFYHDSYFGKDKKEAIHASA